ncbi:MAG: heat shock protein 60, mitochondrial precursor [uncultured bacterium]|nr:MAG: heat shock protein 60, mitochondrial precursor [uncultured bacterium]
MDKNKGILHLTDHLFCICDKIRRKISTIKLHSFNNIKFGLERFCFFNRNYALIPHFFHGASNHFSNLMLTIGRNSSHLGDFLVGRDGTGALFHVFNNSLDSHINSAFEVHRIHPCSNCFDALFNNCMSEDRSCCGPITCNI